MRIPVSKGIPITQGYGKTSFSKFHNGIDFSGRFDRTIYAPEKGTAKRVREVLGGNCVFITGKTGETRLAHLSSYLVNTGEEVREGQAVGIMGRTGQATATHLHWGLKINGKYVNPLLYISKPKEENKDEMFSLDQINILSKIADNHDDEASKLARTKKPGYVTALDYLKNLRDRKNAEIKAKDEIIAEKDKAIKKLLEEKSQSGKQAIVADLEKKTEAPQVEKPSLFSKFLSSFNKLFGGK